jgi:hypothetical protein
MSWDVDEKEFHETFAEITEDRGIEEAKRWAWSALDWTQKELLERDKENDELRKNSNLYTENLPKPHEAGKPSELAQRVTEAFRSSAADVVAVNLARGNTVVGEVNGEWVEKKEQGLIDIPDRPVIHLSDKPTNRMSLYERGEHRREEKD